MGHRLWVLSRKLCVRPCLNILCTALMCAKMSLQCNGDQPRSCISHMLCTLLSSLLFLTTPYCLYVSAPGLRSYWFSLKPVLFHFTSSNLAPQFHPACLMCLPYPLTKHKQKHKQKPLVSKILVISPNYIRMYTHKSLACIWMSYFEPPYSTFHQVALSLMLW